MKDNPEEYFVKVKSYIEEILTKIEDLEDRRGKIFDMVIFNIKRQEFITLLNENAFKIQRDLTNLTYVNPLNSRFNYDIKKYESQIIPILVALNNDIKKPDILKKLKNYKSSLNMMIQNLIAIEHYKAYK